MSTIKFVYRSQNIPDTKPIEGSGKTITSGAVYTALNNIQMDTLFKSGYLPEGIASAVRPFSLTYKNNTCTLQKDSTTFIPNGISDGEFQFKKAITTADISSNSSYSDNMDSFLFYDQDNKKLVARTKRDNTVSAATGEKQDRAVQQVWAQLTAPNVAQDDTSTGLIWWDLTTNYIKVYNNATSSWETKNYSAPLGIVFCANGKITGISQEFYTSGFCGDIAWINPGATFVVSTGIDTKNGTYSNEMLEVTDVITKIIINSETQPFEDYSLYINIDGEIEGPVAEWSFDNNKGLFIDSDNKTHKACRYVSLSGSHLTTNANDPLTVTSYVQRPCMALADNDDIEYVVKLIGSSMGVTIDDLQAEIDKATADRAKIREEVNKAIAEAKEAVASDMHKVMVHRKLPEGTTSSVLNPDLNLNETILGQKTFAETIIGNISGTAQSVRVGSTANEIIPLGVTTYNASGNNEIDASETSVRIGTNYVKAETFNGRTTCANWADLAEMYKTDKKYEVGTLLRWGGTEELTVANFGVCNAVVSDKPGVLLNSSGEGQPIALAGRVYVRVIGPVKKHDPIVLNEMAPGVGKVQEHNNETIVARALEDAEFKGEKLVLCVVKFSL